MPKEIIQKERQGLLQEMLKDLIATLQTLTKEEQIRVLRTVLVFFDLERNVDLAND